MFVKFSDFGPEPGPGPVPDLGPEVDLGPGLEEAGPAAPTLMMRTSSAPGLHGAM